MNMKSKQLICFLEHVKMKFKNATVSKHKVGLHTFKKNVLQIKEMSSKHNYNMKVELMFCKSKRCFKDIINNL